MTKIVAVPLGYILNALYSFIDNYGISIIVFTVLIRLIILPLYAAQLRSTTQMQAMQPKIKEIQTKYANDSQMMNMKLQELYKEEKINPAMGCLPLLIQLPIIWGLCFTANYKTDVPKDSGKSRFERKLSEREKKT